MAHVCDTYAFMSDTDIISDLIISLDWYNKELQAILDERGVVCNGCAEKADLVKMAKESYHLPLKRAEPEPKTASAGES